jgi:hypothetical protein
MRNLSSRYLLALAVCIPLSGCGAIAMAGLGLAVEGANIRWACGSAMDSVVADRGRPQDVVQTTLDEGRDRPKVHWTEWGYPLESAGGLRTDTVTVVGFRSQDGTRNCDVREWKAGAPGLYGSPWEDTGRSSVP